MAASTECLYYTDNCPAKIVKLRVKEGCNITAGQVILHLEHENNASSCNNGSDQCNSSSNKQQHAGSNVLRANTAGLVEKLHVQEGDCISNGHPILDYSVCCHPTVMKDMCAECGADLRETKQKSQTTAVVAMVHNIPELMVSMKEAQSLGKADEERLLRDRKLVLLVDLDQTLIHTTNDNIPPNIEDVFHFQLHGPNSPWYHTRLRPYTKTFLENISSQYELHICTFGSRTYAHMIAGFLDENGRLFSHRILSRDECFSAHSKMANLKALFPCGDHMVVIIDDREDVWNYTPNLIHVRPYHFFQHTGDINAPPGLAKQEKDDKEGFDFSSLNEKEAEIPESIKKEDVPNPSTSGSGDEPAAQGGSTLQGAIEEKEMDDNASAEVPMEQCGIKMDQPDEDALPDGKVRDGQDTTENKVVSISEEQETTGVTTSSVETDKKYEESKPSGDGSDKSAGEKQSVQQECPPETVPDKCQEGKIHIPDTDDYLLHLQDILRTIHEAYYEMYDDNLKKGSKAVPDMKLVLPYVRRKVLSNVRVVFSGVVPTNEPLEKSKPYLVAKSLGATVMDRVTAETTHLIAARLGTAKLADAKKFKDILIVSPEWLWSCAERWERVEERLYPLSPETANVRRKPPAHCTSPVHLHLAMANKESLAKDECNPSVPVYDRITGKRIFQQTTKKSADKGKSLAASASNVSASRMHPLPVISILDFQTKIQKQYGELDLSSDDLAVMLREVDEDIMLDSENEDENDEEVRGYGKDLNPENEDDDMYGVEEMGEARRQSSKKRKREEALVDSEHHLFIGNVTEPNNPDNESLLTKFRHGERIPEVDAEREEEDSNDPEVEELEPDEEADDSEWCLAGEALEREFLSGEED